MRPSPATPEALREAGPGRPGGSRAAGLAGARCVCLGQTQGTLTPSPLARISHQGHGLRGAVGPAGKESRAERCGASGKRLDAPCRPDSTALRVAPRRPPAASRASTVGSATLFGPLLADRTPGRDAGRDLGEESGQRGRKNRPVRANRRLFHARAPATEAAGTGRLRKRFLCRPIAFASGATALSGTGSPYPRTW